MKIKLLGMATLTTLLTISSCKKDTTDYASQANCTGTTPSYTSDIAGILNAHCATSGCHSAASSRAGINLSGYAAASSQFLNNKDNLIAVHHGSGVKPMPEGEAQLSADVINKLDCWVKNGCPQ